MPFDTSQLIPVDNEFSDAAMFIPIESDDFDVTKTPEYGITQKILGVIPKISKGLQIARSGQYAPTSFEKPPSDIIARSADVPQLEPLSEEQIARMGMAGELVQERQKAQRREQGLTWLDRAKIASGELALSAADIAQGVQRLSQKNLPASRYSQLITGTEHPEGQPLVAPALGEFLGTLGGQVKRNVGQSFEQLPETAERYVTEDVAGIAAGLAPLIGTGGFGPLLIGLQQVGAPDLEGEAQALSKSSGIPIEEANQQVLDKAIRNGVITAAMWSALPGPFRKAGEYALSKIPAEAAKLITRPGMFALGQLAKSGLPITGTSTAINVATGQPINPAELPAELALTSLFPAGGKERAREAVERAKLEPTKLGREEEVSKIVQETLDQARRENPDKTFRQASPEEIAENQGRNIWREKYTGDIVFNPEEVGRTISSKNILTKNLRRFFGKGWVHEVIHDNTIQLFGKDAKTEILNFYNNSTALEKALNQRAYEKQWGSPASTEEQLAHEMFRRRVERLTDMTTTELVQTKGMEWLTQKFIDTVERGLIAAREGLKTEASKSQREQLNKYIDRYQKKIDQIRQIKGWTAPQKEEPAPTLGLEPPQKITPERLASEKPEDIVESTAKAAPEARGAMWSGLAGSLTKQLIETGTKAKGNPQAIKSLAEAYSKVTSPEGQASLAAARKDAIKKAMAGDDSAFNSLSIQDQVLSEMLEGATGAAEVKGTNQAEYNKRMAKAFEEAGVPIPDKFKPTEPVTLGMEPSQVRKLEETSKELTPALRVGNVVIKGRSHAEALQNAMQAAKEGKITQDQAMQFWEAHADDARHEFVNERGEVLNRSQGASAYENLTGKKPSNGDQLHSEDLRDAGLLKHLDKGYEPVGQVAEPAKAVTLGMEPAKPKEKEENESKIKEMISEGQTLIRERISKHQPLDVKEWGKKMVDLFGDAIKPELENVYRKAREQSEIPIRNIPQQTPFRKGQRLLTVGEKTALKEVLKASEKAGEAGVKSGIEQGIELVRPKIESLKQKLSQSVSKAAALREYFRGQQKAGQLALQTTRQQLKEADDWLEGDARNIGQSLSQLVRQVLPKSEQGRFLTRITQAMKRAPILSKDPSAMYERASKLAAEIDDYATRYHEITQRNALTDDIRSSVEKALESPTVDINYKNQIRELVNNLRLAKTSQEKIRQLESRKAFVDRMRAEGKENPVPEEYMKELELLSQTSPNDLPIEVLQSMRDRIQLLTELGRKSVKGREALFNAERDAMAETVRNSNATALNDIPQQRTPGVQLPLAQRLMQAVGNKFTTALNAGLKLGRALYQRDVMLDILDKDANYEGGLTKTFGWGLDKAYNKSMNLKDDWMAPIKDVVSKNKINKTSAERISIYAISQEANGMKRLMESGVTPETIAQVRKTITPAELEFYKAVRKVFDDIIYPQLRDFMRDNYNIEVNKVDNYWPFQRDWTQFEAMAKPTAGEQVPGTTPGQQVGFDELAAWKALQENWSPRTTAAKKGMTIERVPEAEGAVRLNALDVVDQHISQAAHLLGQQRTLKMLGQIARQDWFKEKYGNLGKQYILNLLDTVARNGNPSGASRWLALDALRRNTSVGIIGLRLLSQMKHAPNWAFTLSEVKPKHIRDGIFESISDKGQEFIKKNFAEIYQRYGGEPAIAEIGSKGWWQNIQKASFFLERGIDAIHARATVLGAYFQALAKKGIDPSRYAEMPLDEAAAREALIISRKGVTSPLLKDIPQSISRGALTGGNVSLGRAIFQFQNTMLRQWGFMKHDIFDLAIKNWKPGKAATAVLAFASMLAAETLIVETNKLLIEKLSHKLFDTPMARPTKQEREEENVPEYLKFGKNMATELFRRVPFVGNVIAMSKYKELGIPVIDTLMDSLNTVYQGATAKSERGKERAIAKGIGTIATLAGVPGASTALQLYLKGNPPLKTRTRQAPPD